MSTRARTIAVSKSSWVRSAQQRFKAGTLKCLQSASYFANYDQWCKIMHIYISYINIHVIDGPRFQSNLSRELFHHPYPSIQPAMIHPLFIHSAAQLGPAMLAEPFSSDSWHRWTCGSVEKGRSGTLRRLEQAFSCNNFKIFKKADCSVQLAVMQ